MESILGKLAYIFINSKVKKSLTYRPFFMIVILILAAILQFCKIDQPFTDVNSWREASTDIVLPLLSK